jgi:predicted nucleic acid-binding Zn finger protein
MFNLTIPAPKNATEANAQALRMQRARQIIAEGYTFPVDSDGLYIAVCKPGHLSADYFITEVGCDCPDMAKSGKPCKHYIAAWILQEERQEEEAADAAQVARYEAEQDACLLVEDMRLCAQLHREGIGY